MGQILKHFRSVCVVQYKSTGFLTYLLRLSLFRNFLQRSYMLHTTAFQKISNHIQNYMQRFPLHILQSMYFCILNKDVFKFSDCSLWFWKSFLYFLFSNYPLLSLCLCTYFFSKIYKNSCHFPFCKTDYMIEHTYCSLDFLDHLDILLLGFIVVFL